MNKTQRFEALRKFSCVECGRRPVDSMIMNKTERFKKLRSLPCCNCGSTPCDVAHSNSHEDGKGLGLKASDFKTVSLCRTCHQKFDNFSMGFNREQAKAKFSDWLTKTNMALGYKDESAF